MAKPAAAIAANFVTLAPLVVQPSIGQKSAPSHSVHHTSQTRADPVGGRSNGTTHAIGQPPRPVPQVHPGSERNTTVSNDHIVDFGKALDLLPVSNVHPNDFKT